MIRRNPVTAFLTHPLLWTGIIFLILPYVAGANPFIHQGGFVGIGTTMVIFALFASGFNLLFGHVGELSFGHAMFFTIGAYATALYTQGFNVQIAGRTFHHEASGNLWIALVLSLVLATLWGWFLARLVVPRSSGIYFSMITLAFAQVIYFITFQWSDLTGGEDGLQGIPRPPFFGQAHYLDESYHFYWFTAIVVFIALCALYWIIRSPFGSVLHAIRENKQRARFLGYDVEKYRVNAFVLSAVFPAVAGMLWTYYQQAINPDAGSVDYSGNVVMMSLLGGMQTFLGPIIGALIYWELQNNVSQLTKYWPAWIGIVFAVFVLVGPRGIMGVFDDIRHYGLITTIRRWVSPRARVQTEIAEELPEIGA